MTIFGFLPYNLRKKAKVFAGVIGSLSLSFLFAVAVLFLIAETPDATYHLVGPVLILPFLADVLLTMVRRVRAKDNLLQAHNKHLYQRLIRHGFGHLKTSWFYALAALICANIVVIGAPKGWFDRVDIPVMLVGAFSAIYYLVSRSLDDQKSANTRDHKPR